MSEAESYKSLAQANSYFGAFPDHVLDVVSTSRILVEDKALDSFYNILYSVVLFWRTHSVWPEKLTIISHGFKRRRLVDLHCAAIGFPLERVAFVGTDPPVALATGEAELVMASILKAEEEWDDDPRGVGESLASKRRNRNVWGVDQKLFVEHWERQRSGLRTEFLDDGTETLMWTAPRPW